MAFKDDLYRIYEREKEEYPRRIIDNQKTPHPEYEFKTFEEWKNHHGYN